MTPQLWMRFLYQAHTDQEITKKGGQKANFI